MNFGFNSIGKSKEIILGVFGTDRFLNAKTLVKENNVYNSDTYSGFDITRSAIYSIKQNNTIEWE